MKEMAEVIEAAVRATMDQYLDQMTDSVIAGSDWPSIDAAYRAAANNAAQALGNLMGGEE